MAQNLVSFEQSSEVQPTAFTLSYGGVRFSVTNLYLQLLSFSGVAREVQSSDTCSSNPAFLCLLVARR